MPKVFIDGVETSYLTISDIQDSLTPNGVSFSVELLGYPTTLKQGAVRVEIYDDQNDLAAIGNGTPTIKVGLKPRTIYNVIDYTKHLLRKRIVGQYSGLLRGILEQLIIDGNADMYFSGVTFYSDPTTPDIIVDVFIDYLTLKDALSKVLLAAGKQLIYKIPIDSDRIEIIEPGFNPIAPIPTLQVDSLYSLCSQYNIKDITYSKIKPLASVIRVFGLNSKQLYANGSINTINPDILRYRAQESRTQYPLSQTANELLLIRVTTPETPAGECNVDTALSGSNYTTYNDYDQPDYYLPTDLVEDEGTLTFTASESTLIYTATINGVKQNSSISFYLTGSFNGVNASVEITINGSTVYTVDPSDITSTVIIFELFEYVTQNIEVVAIFTIPEQSGTCVDLYGLICPTTKIDQLWLDANCCNIITIAGTGTQGLGDDGLEPTETNFDQPHDVKMLSTGNLIICDSSNDLTIGSRIRKVTDDNLVLTIGGGGANDPPIDSVAATDNFLGQVYYIWVYNDEVYLAAFQYNQVAKIDVNGDYIILYESATPKTLLGICVDSNGIVYVSDPTDCVVYKIINSTTLQIVAGILGDNSYSGDGGLATSAAIGEPIQIAVDDDDNLYICDSNSGAVRKVDATTQIISTFAGNGSTKTFGSNAVGFETFIFGLSFYNGIAYLADTRYVYIVENGILNKYAGMGFAAGTGLEGDGGSPLTAKLNNFGVYGGNLLKTADALYIADPDNYVVRKVGCEPKPTPEGDSCLILTWSASGIFSQINNTPTGKGFEVDISALSASATGEFITNVEIPTGFFHYAYRYVPRMKIENITGGIGIAGTLRLYIESNLIQSIDIFNFEDEGTSNSIDLTAYIGQTIEIKWVYDNTTFDCDPGTATGYIEIAPTRICYKRQLLQDIVSSEDFIEFYRWNIVNNLANPSQSILSIIKDVTLINPDTFLGEFFAFSITAVTSNTPTDFARVLINGINLFGDLDPADFTGISANKILFIPEEYYGQTIEVSLEFVTSIDNGAYEMILFFG